MGSGGCVVLVFIEWLIEEVECLLGWFCCRKYIFQEENGLESFYYEGSEFQVVFLERKGMVMGCWSN